MLSKKQFREMQTAIQDKPHKLAHNTDNYVQYICDDKTSLEYFIDKDSRTTKCCINGKHVFTEKW